MPSKLRSLVGHKAPYWLWRIFAFGMKEHMRENLDVRTLATMVNAPDEALDRKGRWVKTLAAQLLIEYRTTGL